LIVANRDCLASLDAGPVREYSSPAGVHPQPDLTRLIEDLGFTCYYYTGDGGSAPNRTFHEGRAVSQRLIAFPVLPLQESASLGEIIRHPQHTPDDLARWLADATRYCVQERVVRLVYAHPYDLFEEPEAAAFRDVWRAWLDELKALQDAGRLQVRTMGDLAEFLARAWRTEAVFRRLDDGLRVALRNPAGLQDVTVAVPRRGLQAPDSPRISVAEDRHFFFLTIEDAGHALDILLPAR